jgi:hypothetical protein
MSMSSNEVVLALGVPLLIGAIGAIAACDKKDNASPPPTASAAATPSASSVSPADTERKDREHWRDERADGGREHEHEDRPK